MPAARRVALGAELIAAITPVMAPYTPAVVSRRPNR
jgi:hypothetical protein